MYNLEEINLNGIFLIVTLTWVDISQVTIFSLFLRKCLYICAHFNAKSEIIEWLTCPRKYLGIKNSANISFFLITVKIKIKG